MEEKRLLASGEMVLTYGLNPECWGGRLISLGLVKGGALGCLKTSSKRRVRVRYTSTFTEQELESRGVPHFCV